MKCENEQGKILAKPWPGSQRGWGPITRFLPWENEAAKNKVPGKERGGKNQ